MSMKFNSEIAHFLNVISKLQILLELARFGIAVSFFNDLLTFP